jgi:hypothetical protein
LLSSWSLLNIIDLWKFNMSCLTLFLSLLNMLNESMLFTRSAYFLAAFL